MEGATPQWWERERGTLLQLCREAAPSSLCREYTRVTTECDYTEDPATGEPLKRCVKLYKRYLTCAGKPEKVDERWEAAQELSDLGTGRVESPSGHPGPQIEDVGHAVQEFLRFAEELQEQLVPGAIHLDQVPAAAARPYSDAEAQQEQQQQQQQQQQQAFGWLGGLLFGRRRASADAGGGQTVDASTWREFEREFTEV